MADWLEGVRRESGLHQKSAEKVVKRVVCVKCLKVVGDGSRSVCFASDEWRHLHQMFAHRVMGRQGCSRWFRLLRRRVCAQWDG